MGSYTKHPRGPVGLGTRAAVYMRMSTDYQRYSIATVVGGASKRFATCSQTKATWPTKLKGRALKRALPVVAMAIACTSCGNQPVFKAVHDPTISESQMVHIKGDVAGGHTILRGLNKDIYISCVDGQSTDSPNSMSNSRFPVEIEVGPGRHYVGLVYTEFMAFAKSAMWIDTLPSHTYQLHEAVQGGQVILTAIDAATGRSVGGKIGSETNPANSDNCSNNSFTGNHGRILVPVRTR